MNDIQVGELVKVVPWKGFAKVLSLHTASTGKQWAWIEWEDGYCASVKAADLTRIEPEKVTPKYAVNQRRRLRGDHSHIFVADRIKILYQDSGNPTESWYEDALEPVPEPCPECKGSGVASE